MRRFVLYQHIGTSKVAPCNNPSVKRGIRMLLLLQLQECWQPQHTARESSQNYLILKGVFLVFFLTIKCWSSIEVAPELFCP